MSLGSKPKKIKAGPMETKLAELAEREWGDFQEIYVPIENALIEEVRSFGSPDKVAAAQAQATGAVHQQSAGASLRDGSQGAGEKFGELLGISGGVSAGLSAGRTAGRIGEQDRAARGKLGLINVGRNVQALGSAGISASARDELTAAHATESLRSARRGALLDVVGTGVGLAAGYGIDKWLTKKAAAGGGRKTGISSYPMSIAGAP